MSPINQNKATFIYIRITDKEQSKGLGEIQGRELAQWCTQNQITNSQIFADHGASRLIDERPAFARMMSKMESSECSTLVISSLGRIARSKAELLALLETVKNRQLRLVSIRDRLDTRSTLSILTFLEALMKMEKEVVNERLQSGRKKQATRFGEAELSV